MTGKEAARLIDVSAVQSASSLYEIQQLVKYAEQYRFINVHVLPNRVKQLSEMLKPIEGVYVGAPVGFPGGGHKTSVKMQEAKDLLEDGVEEMDIVMNVGRFKSGEYGYVLDELKQIIGFVDKRAKTKVIIELNTLSDEEALKACELVIQSGADFVKTGTGWVKGDANVARIARLMEVCRGRIHVKAAGGIRTAEEFMALYDIGVERMGINAVSAIEIVQALDRK